MLEMFTALFAGLLQVFNWSTFSLMMIGIAVGFVVGILPGLGGPTAMALMLPFIFKMSAVEAFAFLLGMTAVTATTGDITSVLFGVPGEPTTASTIVDGHAMARNGEAGRALGAVLMSSLVGAIFAGVALAVAIPVVRPIVLSFGSPEFFMLSLLGITFVASLSGEDQLKGIVAGGIGLMLATIGLDPISGIQRYTFGQLFLWDGIGLVPITIGFYAIPETIELAVLGTSISQQKVEKLGGVMEGVKDTFRHWWLVIRCSALGTFTAIIPGMGAATTQWLAYAHAVQSSPNKERFGKGDVRGVLGPGAANNSTLGGSLITTIAFGVPASVVMAILLGAFIIQGIVPGPDMLIPPPKGKLDLTFSFVWVIIISNVITVAVCFLFLNTLAKVTQVRGSLIIPLILLLIYLGAFAEKNAFEDMIIVLLFGGLGWVMEKLAMAPSAGVVGISSRPPRRESIISRHRQLWSGMDLAARRSNNLRSDSSRHSLSAHQKEKGGQDKPAHNGYRRSSPQGRAPVRPARRLYGLRCHPPCFGPLAEQKFWRARWTVSLGDRNADACAGPVPARQGFKRS